MRRRTVGALGATAAVLVGLLWAVPWAPQPPWPVRQTQTAVARTETAVATRNAPTRPLTPTATWTPTRTPTASRTVTPSITPTGTATLTPTGVPPASVTPTMVPATVGTLSPGPGGVAETPVPATATWWTGQTYPTYTGPTLTPPALSADIGQDSLDAEEWRYIENLNQYRASLGLAPVVPDRSLTAAAQWMANDMALYGYLSHHDRFGRDSGSRMNDFGSSPMTWRCEMALGGSETGAGTFTVFHLSDSHDPCQRDGKYTIVGVGRSWGVLDNWRWTITLGSDPGSGWPTATPGLTPWP